MNSRNANILNGLVLILMPLWAYLTFEGTAEKPEQSVTALIPLILGVVLILCSNGIKKENKVVVGNKEDLEEVDIDIDQFNWIGPGVPNKSDSISNLKIKV